MKAFTLIEVLAAGLIITMGATASFALVQNTLSIATNAASQFEASYLAQEGMEIVRNIRDTNFLKIHKGVGGNWTDGLTGCAAGCQGDYTQSSLSAFQDTFLGFANGFYSHSASTESIFKRKITVSAPSADTLDVLVEVTWQERGRSHKVQAATQLYNWLEPSL
jgi:hypothetical protein